MIGVLGNALLSLVATFKIFLITCSSGRRCLPKSLVPIITMRISGCDATIEGIRASKSSVVCPGKAKFVT